MKIGLLLQFENEEITFLKNQLPKHSITQLDSKSENILHEIDQFDILIGANASDELIERAINLKLFHVPWVGLDRINFDALQKRNVLICNSKWNEKIVAEFALGLLLAGLKHLVPIHNDFRNGSWQLRGTQSQMVTNSKILLIGFGSIGLEISKLLRPFTKNIIALRYDPSKSTKQEKSLVKKIISWDEYNDEIKDTDYIINSLPLTPNTHGIINHERILMMKKGAYYVNVGRGKTTDEKSLFEALESKHLAGAALDVWYQYKSSSDSEPFYPSKFPFHELSNVLMSPHRAATFSDSNLELIWKDIIYNVEALSTNNPLRNVISYEHRY